MDQAALTGEAIPGSYVKYTTILPGASAVVKDREDPQHDYGGEE
jgi:hypothetical protein